MYDVIVLWLTIRKKHFTIQIKDFWPLMQMFSRENDDSTYNRMDDAMP